MKSTATKLTAFLLSIITALSLTFCVYADVVFEPYGNSFYDEHADETTLVSRNYTAIKDAIVYTAPTSKNEEGKIKAGVTVGIHVLWVDADKKVWGYVLSTPMEGWTDMSAFEAVYDYISFEDDFGNEIVEYNETVELQNPGRTYEYPGAQADDVGEAFEKLTSLTVNSKYTAPDGSEWYYCPYYYGRKNFWVTNATQEQIDAMSTLVLEKKKQTAAQTTIANVTDTTVTIGEEATAATDDSIIQITTTLPVDENTTATEVSATVNRESRVALYFVIGLAVCMAVLIPVIMKRKKGSGDAAE